MVQEAQTILLRQANVNEAPELVVSTGAAEQVWRLRPLQLKALAQKAMEIALRDKR